MKISNRVFWAGVVLACSSILSAGLMAQSPLLSADVLRGKRIEVVDQQNRVRALLTTDAAGQPQFTYMDALGQTRPAVSVLQATAAPSSAGTPAQTSQPAVPPRPASGKISAGLQIIGQPAVERNNSLGSVYIRGTVRNTSDKLLSFVQIKFRCLDASGAQVDTANAITTDLKAGADWKFEAIALKDGIARIELVSLGTSALD